MATQADVVMHPVPSTNVAAVGYDPETQTLRVQFAKSGALYEYDDVPEGEYEGLRTASSVGNYFDGHIKGFYGYRRLS